MKGEDKRLLANAGWLGHTVAVINGKVGERVIAALFFETENALVYAEHLRNDPIVYQKKKGKWSVIVDAAQGK